MKKMLSFCVALALLASFIPFPAFAAESSNSEYDELMDLACEVFPEYAAVIRGENHQSSVQSRSANTRQITITETRQVDENTQMQYIQFSDGLAVVAQTYCDDSIVVSNHTSGGASTTSTVTLRLTCNYSSNVFIAKDIVFTTISQSFDQINSIGDISSSSTLTHRIAGINLYETVDSDAYIMYKIDFYRPGDTPVDVTYYFYVGNNDYWTEHP